MAKRRWKHYQPSTLRDALKGCKDYARERHNLSSEQIAERMGLVDHWVLYKWIQTGRMPIPLLPVYEQVCGINLVSRWIAATAGKLLIDIPSGRSADAKDIQELQLQLHHVTGMLMAFYNGESNAEETLGGIQSALQSLAWHRGNVKQHAQPQLEF
ncbi:hypothetical protein [Nitrincola iocasae]|uniref:Uncharacterized protein n=1 Tax=Nitrincola iocasae TaxID=2614693 RepID=A0A5J6LAJ4_9GAMM|nr:hypothetical protein [Nitrincola iocasae]QEW05629.1 hypothetical protein F5I99_03515 [Nitrincola iocasae]